MKVNPKLVALLVCVLALAGCLSAPRGSEVVAVKARNPTAPASQATDKRLQSHAVTLAYRSDGSPYVVTAMTPVVERMPSGFYRIVFVTQTQ